MVVPASTAKRLRAVNKGLTRGKDHQGGGASTHSAAVAGGYGWFTRGEKLFCLCLK